MAISDKVGTLALGLAIGGMMVSAGRLWYWSQQPPTCDAQGQLNPCRVPSIHPALPRTIMGNVQIPQLYGGMAYDSAGIQYNGPCFEQSYDARIVAQPDSMRLTHQTRNSARPASGTPLEYGEFGVQQRNDCWGIVTQGTTYTDTAHIRRDGYKFPRPRWAAYRRDSLTPYVFHFVPAATRDSMHASVFHAAMAIWRGR